MSQLEPLERIQERVAAQMSDSLVPQITKEIVVGVRLCSWKASRSRLWKPLWKESRRGLCVCMRQRVAERISDFPVGCHGEIVGRGQLVPLGRFQERAVDQVQISLRLVIETVRIRMWNPMCL